MAEKHRTNIHDNTVETEDNPFPHVHTYIKGVCIACGEHTELQSAGGHVMDTNSVNPNAVYIPIFHLEEFSSKEDAKWLGEWTAM